MTEYMHAIQQRHNVLITELLHGIRFCHNNEDFVILFVLPVSRREERPLAPCPRSVHPAVVLKRVAGAPLRTWRRLWHRYGTGATGRAFYNVGLKMNGMLSLQESYKCVTLIADGLVPIWCQAICNHHDESFKFFFCGAWLTYTRSVSA